MRTNFRGCFKKGYTPWNKGKNALYSKEHLEGLSEKGKINAQKRWEGHIKAEVIIPLKRYNKQSFGPIKSHAAYTREWRIKNREKFYFDKRQRELTKNSLGKHTLEEWLMLKNRYHNMCLCCKQFEPI